MAEVERRRRVPSPRPLLRAPRPRSQGASLMRALYDPRPRVRTAFLINDYAAPEPMQTPQEGAPSLGAWPQLRTRPRGVAAPLGVWGLAAATVAGAAAAFGYAPWDSTSWSRWDSGLYEQIARHGYDLFRCQYPYAPGTWCGDAGWFPAYSWLVGALRLVGLPLLGTAVVVSWMFAGATIVLLWRTFLGRRADAAAVGTLLLAAFAPGQ